VHLHALVVVVDGNRQRSLGRVLADDVLVEDLVDLDGLRQRVELEARGRRQLLVDDLVAEIDALVADVDPGARDQLLDLTLGLPAEGAEELLVGVGWTCQDFFPFASWGRIRPVRPRLRDRSRRACASITRQVARSLQGTADCSREKSGERGAEN